MPPAPRKTPVRRQPELDQEPSLVDQMGEDAENVEIPKEYPPGVPALKPLLAIRPRSRRAEFKRRYAEVAEMRALIKDAQAEVSRHKEGSDAHYAAQMRMWAQMDDVYQKVDEALRLAAVDPDAYAEWSDEVSDEDLMTTFNVYQSRTQPGEALSSTS
jgi:hypothetical protein